MGRPLSGEPAWLGLLRRELVAITRGPAASMWPPPPALDAPAFNYRVEHVRQVERTAGLLLRAVPADRDVVLAAVWIHDRFQPLFRGEEHGPRAAAWARSELASRGFPRAKVDAVAAAVERHSAGPGALADASKEARLVWDADKLAHLGAFEVMTLALNNLAADRVAKREGASGRDEADGALAWILETALRGLDGGEEGYAEAFYFPVSRALAEDRIASRRSVVAALAREMDAGR